MTLTALQRDFLVNNLGVVPQRRLLDLMGRFTDMTLESAVDSYLKSEAEILKQLTTLRSITGAASFVEKVERSMTDVQKNVKAARRDGGKDVIQQETTKVQQLVTKAQLVIDNQTVYEQIEQAQKTLQGLDKNGQRAHIAAERQIAMDSLRNATQRAEEGDMAQAKSELKKATDANAKAQKCADDYAKVAALKANAHRLLASMKGIYADETTWNSYSNAINTASAKAEPPTRNYGAATTELNAATTQMKTHMTNWWVTNEPSDLPTLRLKQSTLASKSSNGKTVVDADLLKVAEIRQKIADAVNNSQWPVAMLAATRELPNLLTASLKLADRRIAYDTERETTMTKIEGLKNKKELMGQIFSLNKRVETADQLASPATMRMEDGVVILKEVTNTCVVLTKVYADTKAYLEKREEADEKLALLKEKPSAKAGMLDDQLGYIDGLLLQAQKATGVIDAKRALKTGLNMEDVQAQQVDWALARTTVLQALEAIASADQLADNLADATAVAGEAADADELAKIERLVEELGKQAAQAKSLDHADKAQGMFNDLQSALDEALREATADRIPAAAVLVQSAASLLLGIRTVQTQYAQFVASHKKADDRLKLLLGLTDPPATTVKAQTDAATRHLQAAGVQAEAHQWEKANDLVRNALDEISTGEEFAASRKTFNGRVVTLTNDANSTSDPLKGQIVDMISKAKVKADGFNFVQANRLLDNAQARVASKKVKEKISAGVVDDEFLNAIDSMMAATGGEELLAKSTDNPTGRKAIKSGPELLDELVQGMGDDVPVKVIIAIAKKRFNLDLSISALRFETSGVLTEDKDATATAVEPSNVQNFSQRTKSAKKIYEMLALTPEQSKDNPSLKKVTRENALKNIKFNSTNGNNSFDFANGGYYRGSDSLTSISGRPGDTMQKFGSKQKGYQKDRNGDPVRNSSGQAIEVDQLPAYTKEFEAYAPANEDDIDYFDFANVHETGHAVDDRLRFMASRAGESQVKFGGWVVHGSNIEAIAKQVVKKYGPDHAQVLEPYAADVIIGAKVEKPVVDPADQIAVNTACEDILKWFDIATKCSPWWDHAASKEITMLDGRVYQEAYPRTWVSYPFSERAKGITGYQFRAPGEWFAELYAAFHLGKLKPGHPARQWLSSLQL